MKKILITGITGMIGKHLAKVYHAKGYEVAGISRATSASRYSLEKPFYKHYQGDIMDVKFLKQVWKEWEPDVVFHLAAQAYNGESWKAEDTTYQLNIQGSRNVFETCLEYSPNARVIPACSSAEYGFVPEELIPIQEDTTPLQPITPYGVSKASMEMMARQFHLNYKLDVVLPRLFIHVGPDHPPVTALQNFSRQLASIKLGLQPPVMYVGNLSSSRDFVDVRDGAEALFVLAEKGESGAVYNLCSGKAWTMQESLDMLINISGTNTKVETDPKLFRPSDEKILLGDPSKLKALGWSASTPFQKTLEDIFQNWVERLSK
ncbi:GDP-mannose 4,6-dehydratase [Phaeodactylibacter xiamenensis]|uniref:GDP-mannose 4,6-dehydratase n=1 Tax=Phaeodactylibacter xiamenensis TaxID=1524460 RepID=UPI0024A7A690|nr:GDP-mannose 4,6-dehydratase [Phaeodactylibacter xiamenensis]